MTASLPQLDARLDALRETMAGESPPPSVDRAIAAAVARAERDRRRARQPSALRRFDAWFAWPVALAASITLLSFVIRSVPPQTLADPDPTRAAVQDLPATASFMPLVPIAELERAGDALVVPARMSRMSLAQFGLPVNPARAADPIDTELLVRSDGAVLALRFVHE
jgi:hypothetical protein